MRKLVLWLWPTGPGLIVPGFWAAYWVYAAAGGLFPSWPVALAGLWPLLPLYVGSCLLAAWERRGARPRLAGLVMVGVFLAAADLALKVWIEGPLAGYPHFAASLLRQSGESPLAGYQPLPLVPGLLAIDPVYNVYGTMLAIPGATPFVTALAVLLVPGSVASYVYYRREEKPVVWAHVAFIGFFAGALAKAGDLLWRGLIVDYLHIPGLPVADLADVYLIWIGGACALAATFCYPGAWPSPRAVLRALRHLARKGTEGQGS